MRWEPPKRFRYVTALEDAVPPDRLGELVDRLLAAYVAPGGRLILSAYADGARPPRPLFVDLAAAGHPADGPIHIDRPGRSPLLSAWIDA